MVFSWKFLGFLSFLHGYFVDYMDFMDMHVMIQNSSSKVIHQVAGQVLYMVYMDITWMSLVNVLDVSNSCMDITLISMCMENEF